MKTKTIKSILRIIAFIIMLLIILIFGIQLYKGKFKKISIPTSNGPLEIEGHEKRQTFNNYRDSLLFINGNLSKELNDLKREFGDLKNFVKDEKQYNLTKRKLDNAISAIEFEIAEGERLARALNNLSKKDENTQVETIKEVIKFLSKNAVKPDDKSIAFLFKNQIHEEELKEYSDKVVNLESKVDSLNYLVSSLRSKVSSLNGIIDNLNQRLNQKNNELNLSKNEVAELMKKLSEAENIILNSDQEFSDSVGVYALNLDSAKNEILDLLGKNDKYKKQLESVKRVSVVNPRFYPIESKMRKEGTFVQRQIETIMLKFKVEGNYDMKQGADEKIIIKYGIPVSSQGNKYQYKTETHTVKLGKENTFTLGETGLMDNNGNLIYFKTGLYYVRVYYEKESDENILCRLDFDTRKRSKKKNK